MQGYRDGELRFSATEGRGVTNGELISELMEQMQERKLDQVVIATIPAVNEIVTVRGLQYVVTHSFENGFRAELRQPPAPHTNPLEAGKEE